jgi:hypothetical protein
MYLDMQKIQVFLTSTIGFILVKVAIFFKLLLYSRNAVLQMLSEGKS